MPRKKRASPARLPELSRLEVEVMDVIWRLGECSSAEATSAVARKRPLAPTTVRTVLANLRKKGYIEPIPTIERNFRWKPAVDRQSVVRRTVRTLVAGLFGGSPRHAIACLLNEERLTDADLAEIRAMLDHHSARDQP